MTDHPLTDEIIDEIAQFNKCISDLGAEGVLNRDHDMRAAADWQLERDLEVFKKFLVVSLGIYPPTAELMAQDFKAVMRPEENNA